MNGSNLICYYFVSEASLGSIKTSLSKIQVRISLVPSAYVTHFKTHFDATYRGLHISGAELLVLANTSNPIPEL